MDPIDEDAAVDPHTPSHKRKLLLAVDDNPDGERALIWALEHLYRPGDEFHLVHVIPKLQMPVIFGAPPVDFLPQQDPEAHEKMTLHAQLFIEERYLPRLAGFEPPAAVHIVKGEMDSDSIGQVLCRKAEMVGAAALIMASQSKTKLQEFFLGSVTNYCMQHSRKPVLVVP